MKKLFFSEKRIVCADIAAGSNTAGAETTEAPVIAPGPAPEQAGVQQPAPETQKPAAAPEAAPPLPETKKVPEIPQTTAKNLDDQNELAQKTATTKFDSTRNKLGILEKVQVDPMPVLSTHA